MPELSMQTTIHAPLEKIWRTITDYDGLKKIFPLLTTCNFEHSSEGFNRIFTMPNGSQLYETISVDNPCERAMYYSISDTHLSFKNYVGTMKLRALENEECEIEWSCAFEPKEDTEESVTKMITGFYSIGFERLKKMLCA